MKKELKIYEAEIANPETGELLTFKGRLVDVGYFFKKIKDQIYTHEKEIRSILGLSTWKQVQKEPGSPMTRHYEGDIGRVTVKVSRDLRLADRDITELRQTLDDKTFYKLFKAETTYKPRMRELKNFLHTTVGDPWFKRAKAILQVKMKLAEPKFTLSYEEKKGEGRD